MDQATHSKIVSFIWAIADGVLRDLCKRGKYPDVILPMCVIRRMDAVLERTKQQAIGIKKMLDDAHITEQRAALYDATKIGYEMSFTRHFYKPKPMRTLAEISADILAIEKEAEGLPDGLLTAGAKA